MKKLVILLSVLALLATAVAISVTITAKKNTDKYTTTLSGLSGEFQKLSQKYEVEEKENSRNLDNYHAALEALSEKEDIIDEQEAEIEELAKALKTMLIANATDDSLMLAQSICDLDTVLNTEYFLDYVVGKEDEDGYVYDENTAHFLSAQYLAADEIQNNPILHDRAIRSLKLQLEKLGSGDYYELVWLVDRFYGDE